MSLCRNFLLLLIIIFVLIGCGSAAEESSKVPAQEDITVRNDSASGDRQTPITTPDVLANDEDHSGNGELVIVEWTQPSSGTVDSNGDGTFTFTPTIDTPSGDLSFQYTVVNSRGARGNGTVTLTISASWGNLIEHATAQFLGSQSTLTDEQGNIFLIYVDSEPKIRAYDPDTAQWHPAKLIPDLSIPAGLTRNCVPQTCRVWAKALGNGRAIIFQMNTLQQFYTRIYDISDNSISAQELLLDTTESFADFKVFNDQQHNLLVIVSENLTAGTELQARYYAASDSSWKNQHTIAVTTDRYAQAWLDANNVFVTMNVNGALSSNHFNVSNDSWFGVEPISDAAHGNYTRQKLEIDDQGNILALWVQNPSTSREDVYANYYTNATPKGAWGTPPTTAISSADTPSGRIDSITTITHANSNYSIIWERLLNANNNSLGSYWANYFNNQNDSFAASSSPVYEGSGVSDPNIVSDNFGNLTVIGEKFVSNGGATTYSVMTNRMSANGSWGSAAEHATPVERPNGRGKVAYGVTDSSGNVIMVYHKISGSQYELLVDEYNNLSNSWLGAEAIVTSSNIIEAFSIYTSTNQRPIVVWSERYTDINNNTRFKALSKIRLSQSSWDTEKVIADQLMGYAEPVQFYIDNQNYEKLLWSENPLLNGAIWSANYNSNSDQWQQARNLVPGSSNSYFQYMLYPIGSGEIQLIVNSSGASMTLSSIDYR